MTSYQNKLKTKGTLYMPLLDTVEKPMKPAEHAEHLIIQAILDQSYLPGDTLPAERALAQSLGVTRPTLRETLQRLSREGWVTISHGKPTRVNDYLSHGGLGILTTLARYGDYLTREMVSYLLDVRTLILPGIARQAVGRDPEAILSCLNTFIETEKDAASIFTQFDWQLQILMVKTAGNPVFKMIYNDFAPVFQVLGERYFSSQEARKKSITYYRELEAATNAGDGSVFILVETAMKEARELWEAIS